eukprot:Rmarinus@m.9638
MCKVEVALKRILRQYRAAKPCRVPDTSPRDVNDSFWVDVSFQRRVFCEVIHDEICTRFPPPSSYTLSFLKRYVNDLGKNTVLDELVEMIVELEMEMRRHHDVEGVTGYRTYEVESPLIKHVTFRESTTFNETGLTTWEAGWRLFEMVLCYPNYFLGRRCLEFGSGVGMLGPALFAHFRTRKSSFSTVHQSNHPAHTATTELSPLASDFMPPQHSVDHPSLTPSNNHTPSPWQPSSLSSPPASQTAPSTFVNRHPQQLSTTTSLPSPPSTMHVPLASPAGDPPTSLVLTDYDPKIVDNIAINLRANGVPVSHMDLFCASQSAQPALSIHETTNSTDAACIHTSTAISTDPAADNNQFQHPKPQRYLSYGDSASTDHPTSTEANPDPASTCDVEHRIFLPDDSVCSTQISEDVDISVAHLDLEEEGLCQKLDGLAKQGKCRLEGPPGRGIDMVLAADLFFDPGLIGATVRATAALLHSTPTGSNCSPPKEYQGSKHVRSPHPGHPQADSHGEDCSHSSLPQSPRKPPQEAFALYVTAVRNENTYQGMLQCLTDHGLCYEDVTECYPPVGLVEYDPTLVRLLEVTRRVTC